MGGCMVQSNDEHCRNKYSKSRFKFIQVIGKGSFGQVWKVIDKYTNEVAALKIMDKAKIIAKKSIKAVIQQRNILETLALDRSDLISNILASFQDREKAYILMELISGKNLRAYLMEGTKFNEDQIKFIVVTLLKIVRYIHSKSIIHGDIKPENIMIDNRGFPHITDFGIASFFKPKNSYQNGGTLAYMAPEVILGIDHGYSIDYYAIGVITFQLFFQRRPHTSLTYDQLTEEILGKDINFASCPELQTIPKAAADFIIQLTQRKPQNRLGAQSINAIFEHSWINSENVESLVIQNTCRILQPSEGSTIPGRSAQEMQTEDGVNERIKKLLDRPHIQKMFEAFNSPKRKDRSLSASGLVVVTQRSYSLTAKDLADINRKSSVV